VAIFSAIGVLGAILILPKNMFGYVETETAELQAKAEAA